MRQPLKKVFHGKALAIVKSNSKKGTTILIAKSKDLKSAKIEIEI